MAPLAIQSVGLGKRYSVGEVESAFRRMRRAVARAPGRTSIWALRDASFDVAEGERVAIIGRNGAGKSTLLKLLARVTEPTAGYADVRGRVGALLEVGTGFHPELTGRENVYLNGAILGMRKEEVARKLDAIVEFSGVGPYLDTPVKWYSSGMYVRLAFSVAAHLEPEILVVDEVLAVGDAEFQKRCLARMSEVAQDGRTVLFVSHNMQAARRLCDRAILLEKGRLVADGDVETIARDYLAAVASSGSGRRRWDDPEERPGDEACRLVEVAVADEQGDAAGAFFSSRPICLNLELELESVHPALNINFDLLTPDGVLVFHSSFRDGDRPPELAPGRNLLRCRIPPGLLNSGRYVVTLRISLHHVRWIVHEEGIVDFDVLADHGSSLFLSASTRPGVIAPVLEWDVVDRDPRELLSETA
jgi:lipopolysaccharide transport system ATP-binding protein